MLVSEPTWRRYREEPRKAFAAAAGNNRKEQHMKRITKITLFALGLAGLASVALLVSPALVKAANENILTFDIACDCRTGAAT